MYKSSSPRHTGRFAHRSDVKKGERKEENRLPFSPQRGKNGCFSDLRLATPKKGPPVPEGPHPLNLREDREKRGKRGGKKGLLRLSD